MDIAVDGLNDGNDYNDGGAMTILIMLFFSPFPLRPVGPGGAVGRWTG